MSRRRAGAVIVLTLVVALLGLGWWRRSQLIDERASARSTRHHELQLLAATRDHVRRTLIRAGAIESDNAALRAGATELTGVAQGLSTQIASVQRERDDAAVAAFFAGGQAGQLRTCLEGIDRALNQVSVGDPTAVRSLATVRGACQAVGA